MLQQEAVSKQEAATESIQKIKENVQVRVYGDFTEVREKLSIQQNGYCVVTLPEEQFQQIISDSIEVENDHCKYQTVTRKSINLEGRTVHVRRNRTGHGKEEIRKAILVRGNDLLVKDVETKRYYNVSRNELEFDDMPTDNVYNVEFFFDEKCNDKDTILRYQLSTIKWKPKYELNLDDNSSEPNKIAKQSFKCIAVLENNSPTNFIIEKAELFGGQISRGEPVLQRSFRQMARAELFSSSPAAASVPQSSFESTELSGIYMYELLNQFQLNAYSSAYVEFIRPNVDVEELSTVQLSNPGNLSKPMDRMYIVVSDEFLPSGLLNIRQQNRLIGSHNLYDLPAKEKREIILGQDSASLLKREQKVVSEKHKQTVLTVCLELINNHTKARRFRFRETFYLHQVNTKFEFDDSTNMKLIEHGLEINISIQANGSSKFQYNVIKTEVDPKK